MLLHPLQEEALVEEPGVEVAVAAHVLAGEEAKEADTVVEGDDDNVVVGGFDNDTTAPVTVGICYVS